MGNSVFFLCCCWSTVRMWLGNLEHEKLPSFISSSPHVRECGFRNPRNFCWWNPESRKLLEESGILGFGIRNPSKDLNPEPKFHWQRLESSTWESGIHGVELRIQDCLGFPYMGRSSWCTTKWNVASDWCSFSTFVSECQNYGSLNSGTRRPSYGYGYYCDNGLGPGWFRFQGSAGTRMATSCISYRRCGTYYPGWLNGGHPTVADGQVTRTVCFNSGYNCCYYSRSIKVRNCGSYYVYYLNGTPTCNARYCGTN